MERGGVINKVSLIVAGLGGLLVALTTLGENIAGFSGTKAYAYLYVGSDLFVVEMALLFIALLLRPVWRIVGKSGGAVPELWRSGASGRAVVAVGALVLLGCAGLSGYQTYYYLLGKRIAIRNHSTVLADRAAIHYFNGNEDRARSTIGICITVFSSDRCQLLLSEMDRRKERADLLTLLYANTSASTWSRPTIALGIYMQDRNWTRYDARMNAEVERLERMKVAYRNAVTKVSSGELDDALVELRAIDKIANYGQTPRLIQEVENLKRGGSKGVVLRALQDDGVDTFIADTSGHYQVVRLTSPWYGGSALSVAERSGSEYVSSPVISQASEFDEVVSRLENGRR